MVHRFSLMRAIPVLFWLMLTTLAAASAYAQTPAAAPGSPVQRILVLGDSLSAEYGLTRGTGWVQLLQERLNDEAPGNTVINASISGDTTSGGLGRLPPLLAEHDPDIVIIELGGNDALRGLPLELTDKNLRTMARAARDSGAQVIVVGMQIPPNYGRTYANRFQATFGTVAEAEDAALVPFLLEGMATDPAMFQADRIHPTAQAQPILLDNVWPVLQPLL